MSRFTIGVDLAQASDYTAVCVLEQTAPRLASSYAVPWLERWQHISYVEQVARLQRLLAAPELVGAPLIVDQTGVGVAVLDQLRAADLRPIGISIHGGDVVTGGGDAWRVPKRDLVSVVAVLLQAGRLQIAEALPLAAVLAAELQNFRVTFDPRTAHDSYAAWREADHDDLVLATALACWWQESGVGAPPTMHVFADAWSAPLGPTPRWTFE
jgi:hypothetical protein